jgi:PAS domain S-box-containing protein
MADEYFTAGDTRHPALIAAESLLAGGRIDPVTVPADVMRELLARHALVEAVINRATMSMAVYDREARFVLVNQAMVLALQRAYPDANLVSERDIIGITWRDLGMPEQAGEAFETRLRSVFGTGQETLQHITYDFLNPPQYWTVRYRPLPDSVSKLPTYVLAMYEDMTDTVTAQNAARENEQRYRILAELTTDYAYGRERSPDGTIRTLWVSAAYTNVLGYTVEELDTIWPEGVIHPEDLAMYKESLERVYERGIDTITFRVVSKSGHTRWVRDFKHGIRAEEERFLIFGAAQDITEQMNAYQELSESESRLTALLNNLPQAVFFLNAEGKVILFNKQAAQTVASLIDSRNLENATALDEYIIDSERESIHLAVGKALNGRKIRGLKQLTARDNTILWYDYSFVPVFNEDSEVIGVVVSALDITERIKEMEERERLLDTLRERAYAARLGDLLAGILHVVNNKAAAIQGYAGLISESNDPENLEFARHILESIRQLRTTTNDLRDYIRVNEFTPVECTLADIVYPVEAQSMSISPHVAIELRTGNISIPAIMDTILVQKAVVHLITNAVNAVETRKKQEPEDYYPQITTEINADEDTVRIKVTDNGIGISPKNISSVFAEGYTAKGGERVASGYGLGLPFAKRVAEVHNGTIQVQSVVRGTAEGVAYHTATVRNNVISITDVPEIPPTEGLQEPAPRIGTTITITFPRKKM